MPEVWMPGLIKDPGRSHGYPGGRIQMRWCKHHDTAGTDSYNICKWGRPGYQVSLCQILLPKVGVPWQFCEIDSNCADSGVWNQWGPGLEVERLGHQEDLTPDQIHWLGEINRWLESEWGIPNIPYRGPQFGAENFRGHVNHSDIAYNPDGLTEAEWDAVTTGDDMTKEEHDALFEVLEWIKGGAFIPPAKSIAGRVANIDGVLTGGDAGTFPPMEKRIVKDVNDHTDSVVSGSAGSANPVSYTITGKAVPE